MKSLYEIPVLAEMGELAGAESLEVKWLADNAMPVIYGLLAMGHLKPEVSEGGITFRPFDDGRIYYTVPETMASPEELFSHIVGAGFLGESWWHVHRWDGVDEDGNVAPDWALPVTLGDEDDGGTYEGIISAATLAQAVMRIRSGVLSMPSDLMADCVLLAEGRLGETDIDAGAADLIAQVAVTGTDSKFG